jgi:hypothetical protein
MTSEIFGAIMLAVAFMMMMAGSWWVLMDAREIIDEAEKFQQRALGHLNRAEIILEDAADLNENTGVMLAEYKEVCSRHNDEGFCH